MWQPMDVPICEDCNLIGVQWGLVGAASVPRWCPDCASCSNGHGQARVVVNVLGLDDTALLRLWATIVELAATKAGRSTANIKAYVSKGCCFYSIGRTIVLVPKNCVIVHSRLLIVFQRLFTKLLSTGACILYVLVQIPIVFLELLARPKSQSAPSSET